MMMQIYKRKRNYQNNVANKSINHTKNNVDNFTCLSHFTNENKHKINYYMCG